MPVLTHRRPTAGAAREEPLEARTTKAELKEVEAQLIVRNHPSLYDGDVFALVVDPLHLSIRRQVAAGLKTFAKKAAKDPLNTGT